MENIEVSIVIPVYNGDRYLRDAIDSSLTQTWENIEIIIVNDGSTDGGKTEQIALSYGDKVKYFHKPNGGTGSALNLAISKASGDYISWLSHDDLYAPDKIEKQLAVLGGNESNRVILYSNYAVFTDIPEYSISVCLKGVKPVAFRYWLTVENSLHGCTLLIPRAAFDKIGYFNERLKTTQDYDLWFRMAREYDFVHMPEQLVFARSHAEQGSFKMADVALAECNNLLSAFIDNLGSDEITSVTGKSLSESYVGIAVNMFDRGFFEAGKLAERKAMKSGSVKEKVFCYQQKIRRNFHSLDASRSIRVPLQKIRDQFANFRNNPGSILQKKFTDVYSNNLFRGKKSRSGEGSDLVQTKVVRRELPSLISEFSIQTVIDAPCGDMYWMKETELNVSKYIGVDIVNSLIQEHKRNYPDSNKIFICLNLSSGTLPQADLIFCRDCLVHLNFYDALRVIRNFKKSGSKYLLTTSFEDRTTNTDLEGPNDFWRPLNLTLPPFSFPQPIRFINENCTEEDGCFSDKGLGLWNLSEILPDSSDIT